MQTSAYSVFIHPFSPLPNQGNRGCARPFLPTRITHRISQLARTHQTEAKPKPNQKKKPPTLSRQNPPIASSPAPAPPPFLLYPRSTLFPHLLHLPSSCQLLSLNSLSLSSSIAPLHFPDELFASNPSPPLYRSNPVPSPSIPAISKRPSAKQNYRLIIGPSPCTRCFVSRFVWSKQSIGNLLSLTRTPPLLVKTLFFRHGACRTRQLVISIWDFQALREAGMIPTIPNR